MQSCVIVLLKLLLATVTGPGIPGGNIQAPVPIASPANEHPRKSLSYPAVLLKRTSHVDHI